MQTSGDITQPLRPGQPETPAPLGGDETTGGPLTRPAPGDPDALPTRIGRYHVLGRVGAGGMGVVLAAYDPDLDRKVAVKLLRVDRKLPDSQARLLREAQALARLSHPNVVQVHDAGAVGMQVFLAMEFVRGADLKTWLKRQERSVAEIVGAFLDAGRGLAAAHDAGLVHRDFKPENVLVGDDGRVRVVDFGLARQGDGSGEDAASASAALLAGLPLDLSLTATGAVLGTPAYMSPEQYRGEPTDARSDQFSFCVALWEALHGARPFAGSSAQSTAEAVLAGRQVEPPAGTRAPRRLAEVLRRGLSTRPDARWPDMHALLAALARDPSQVRRRWLTGVGVVGLALGTAFGVIAWRDAERACSGGAAELAATWGAAQRDAVGAALRGAPDPGLATHVPDQLDVYAAAWARAHRDACLAHRRGEQSSALLDTRMRCLARRRKALGSAVAAIVSAPAERPADAAQVVARLPPLAACDDPETALLESPLPPDPSKAFAAAELDARLIDARALHHAGDIDRAAAAVTEAIAAARRLDLQALLAEALLLRGQIESTRWQMASAYAALSEAGPLALAARRDDVAVEALARQFYIDAGQFGRIEPALALAPTVRALAERLPAPAAALARVENNLGTVYRARGDTARAHQCFERAVAAAQDLPDVDPIELATYLTNLGVGLEDPARRSEALARAAAVLEQRLGRNHFLTLERQLFRACYEADLAVAVAVLEDLCRSYATYYPEHRESCVVCRYYLGRFDALRGRAAAAAAAYAGAATCGGDAPEAEVGSVVVMGRERAAAQAALLAGDPARALTHATALRSRVEPLRHFRLELADAELSRGQALLGLGRADEAVPTLERAVQGLDESVRASTWTLARVLAVEARVALARALELAQGAAATAERRAALRAEAERGAAELGVTLAL